LWGDHAGSARRRADQARHGPLARHRSLLHRGVAGTGRIPGKHGGPARTYATVQVIVGDRPGELARLFQAAKEAGVNIEDVRLEHAPGLPLGAAELWVRPEAVTALAEALRENGWHLP
ncbi:prephenate dehydrogenase, partial [Streptosporangium sp. NPDC048865]